jgi:multidrug efflux pump subunit AcrB
VKNLKKLYSKDGQDRLLPKFSLFIFDRSRTAAIIWLCLTVFGVLSYTMFLKREGFPSITIPFSVVTGTYFVDDAAKVDTTIAKPVSDIILRDNRVKSIKATSQAMFYSVVIQYEEGTDAEIAGKEIKQKINDANIMPKQATLDVTAPRFGFTERGDDAVISVYSTTKNADPKKLEAEGDRLVGLIKAQSIADVDHVSVVNQFASGTNPATGKAIQAQDKFDRYAERQSGQNVFYNAISVGVMQKGGSDAIKLDEKLRAIVDEYNREQSGTQYKAAISATYANDIKDQISELQKALLEGLLAVLVIGSLVIAVRASIVTVIAMLTVLTVTLGLLFTVGYTLNTITLFSLILCLGLIVDDTIIMVEAIDAQRRKRKDPRETVHEATRKVSRAMIAATSTAALSFAPLLFVGGVLGSFIRAIPVTIISALVTSLLVALIFIPLFAKYLLLGKKQMGAENVHEPAAKLENRIAHFITKPMLWAEHSRKKLFGVGLVAVAIGMLFIGAGGYLFQKVTFNIFPPSKDTNGVTVQLTYAPGTTIQQAQAIADRADKIAGDTLGENLKSGAYFTLGDVRSSTLTAYLISYKDRETTSVQLTDQLKQDFKGFQGAAVEVAQLDVGPPSSAFTVTVDATNRPAALRLTNDIKQYINGLELTRLSGEKAHITSASVSNSDVYTRDDGKPYVSVTGKFDGTDTSALVELAKTAVNKEFTASKVASYGLSANALRYDLGQEQENQDSFSTLLMAFPILLGVIYLLLCFQFRSLLQPLLIFMAIPFSLLGITSGLYLTDNPFSFFAMLGFFALIGLSIKNTILLTDYANQLRRSGSTAVDAAAGALAERFRPLVATSLTAIASLIPLMISSPFWEGLTVVLICGLLSSTILVIVVFPYYYLGAEFLRLRVSRTACLLWLGFTAAFAYGLISIGMNAGLAVLLGLLAATALTLVIRKRQRRAPRKNIGRFR